MAQIGIVKIQTQNSGVVNVPVFEEGDAGNGVYEMVRVQTESGTGFIPVVDKKDSSFPYLRVQTQSHGTLAVHNSSSLSNTKLIDNFEDGNLSEYGGSTSNFYLTRSPTYRDSYALEFNTSSSGTNKIVSLSGLESYPKAGDSFSYWFRHDDSDHQLTFWFGAQDGEENCYKIRTGNRFNNVEIVKRTNDGGNYNQLASSSISYNTKNWYKALVEWKTNGKIICTIYNSNGDIETSASATDTTYKTGGIGWGGNAGSNGETAYADYARIL
jgi:hypothetical protein